MTAPRQVITAKVYRFNPNKDQRARFETYQIPYRDGLSVMNVIQYIYEHIDPTLSHYYSCRIGRCGGCHIFVNGRAVQSCCTRASDEMVIEPPHRLGLRVHRGWCNQLLIKPRRQHDEYRQYIKWIGNGQIQPQELTLQRNKCAKAGNPLVDILWQLQKL